MQVCNNEILISNALRIYTECFGNKLDEAVLLISGAMSPARFWIDEFCQQLSRSGYFVIRYDHRDMGLSTSVNYSKNPYNLNDLAKDAISILDGYKIKKAHIIGHSMGGAIAQLIALTFPARVLSLSLVSSSVLADVEFTEEEKKLLESTWKIMMTNKPTKKYEESVDGFMQAFKFLHGDISIDSDIALAYIKDMYYRSKPEHIAWFERFSTGVDTLHNHVKAQQNVVDRTRDLKNINVPIIVIHGEKDCLTFPRIIKKYCVDFIIGSRVYILDGMGHMILNRKLFEQIGRLILKNIKK